MRRGIRTWLARRDRAREPRSGRLQLLADSLRGQIDASPDEGDGPTILVDDLELRWDELGQVLAAYEGWHVRIEIRDPADVLR